MPQSIEYSATLAGLTKFGPRDACCAEIPHRMGDYRTFAETVERARRHLEALETGRLVCYCGSCANYLGNIWPEYHGVRLTFKVISLWEWLWEKYQAGDLTIRRQLSKPMIVNDSCYGSKLGDNFFEAVRGPHQAAGMEVVELENKRYDNLICGFAAALRNNYDQTQVAGPLKRKVGQVLATGVKDVACYCPGCWASFNGVAKQTGLKIHYAISRILWAFGDEKKA